MKILFDLVHPANVLFFYHPIRLLSTSGADVRIASRHKEVLVKLLDEFDLSHKPLSTAVQAALDIRPAYVFVSSGSEARPAASHVVWVGGTSRPTNTLDGDLWLSETA